MPAVSETIDINAPIEKVFRLVAHMPERMPEWWRPMELHQRVTPAPTSLGSISRYVYNMVGIRIKGEHHAITYEENRRLIVHTISGLESSFSFEFQAVTGFRTRLTIRVEYQLPGAIIGKLISRAALEQRNMEDVRGALKALKTMVESEVATSTH